MTPKQLAKTFVNEVKGSALAVADFAAPYITAMETVIAIEPAKATTVDYEMLRNATERLNWATDRTGLIVHSTAIKALFERAKQWSKEKSKTVVVTEELIKLLSLGIAALYTGEEGSHDSIYLTEKSSLPFPVSNCCIISYGSEGRPVVWFETHYDITRGRGSSSQFYYSELDIEMLQEALVKAGAKVRSSWNGVGTSSVSFGLQEPAKTRNFIVPEGWR